MGKTKHKSWKDKQFRFGARLAESGEDTFQTISEQLAYIACRQLALKYYDEIVNILCGLNVPDHDGAIVFVPIDFTASFYNTKDKVACDLDIILPHGEAQTGRSMSNKRHHPVDLMYLFNNGWENSSLIFNSKKSMAAGKDQNKKWKHTRWNLHESQGDNWFPGDGNYPGDGFIFETIDKFKRKHKGVHIAPGSAKYGWHYEDPRKK